MAAFFALQYRVLFHDTMAYGSHHFLTNFKFQCIAREKLYFENVVDFSEDGKSDDASLVLLTQQGYTRNMAPVVVGQKVGILVSAEAPGPSSIRFCFRVIRGDGEPVCCGFQTVVCVSPESGQLVPAPESILRGSDLMTEILTDPSFADRAFTGRTRPIFTPDIRALGQAIANESAKDTHPRFVDASLGLSTPDAPLPQGNAHPQPTPSILPGPHFLFPGQGSFRPAALKALCHSDPEAAALLRYADVMSLRHFGASLSEAFAQGSEVATESFLRANPDLVQVGMYVSAVAIARSMMASGTEPRLLMGHSAGEIPALAIGGAFEDRTGVEIVCQRALALRRASLTPGGMVALMTHRERVDATLIVLNLDDLEVAVTNHPLQSVVAGPLESLGRLLKLVPQLGIGARALESPYPFHTSGLKGAIAPFKAALSTLEFHPPQRPIYSPIEGRFFNPQDDIPALLASHFTRPLDFAAAIKDTAQFKPTEIIECGPPMLGKLIPKILGESQAPPRRFHPLFDHGPSTVAGATPPPRVKPKQGVIGNIDGDDIVVTAMGCVVPGGSDPAHFWESILSGRGGIVDGGDLSPEARLDFLAPLSPEGRPTPDKTYTLLSGAVSSQAVEAWPYNTRAQRLLREALAQCLGALPHGAASPEGAHLFLGATADGIAEYDLTLMAQDLLTLGAAHGLEEGPLRQALASLDLTPPDPGKAQGPYALYRQVVSDTIGDSSALTLLDAACASSLYAIILGAMSLRDGTCDLAICGGVFAPGPANSCLFSQFRGLSGRGSDPLTARADGVIFGEGASLVTLRRFKDAKALGEPILGVLRGEGIGSDGKSPSVAVPKGKGQHITMARAYSDALTPASIDCVEAHATSTPVGDAVEFGALGAVFEGCPTRGIHLGSVKGLTGHTGWAAGSTSTIKMLKAMEAKTHAPQAGFDAPNPKIDLDSTPFHISPTPSPWPEPEGRGRRGAINSFGFGGANAHLVIEEPKAGHSPKGSPGGAPEKHPSIKDDPIVITAIASDLPGEGQGWRAAGTLPPIPKGVRILPDVLDDMDTGQRLAVSVSGALLDSLGKGTEDWAHLKDEIAVVLGAEGKSLRGREITLRLHRDRLNRRLGSAPSPIAGPFKAAIAEHLETIPASGPYTLPGMMPNVASGRVANAYGLRGPNLVVGAGTKSLESALKTASLILSQGRAKLALSGALVGNELASHSSLPSPNGEGLVMVTLAPRSLAQSLGLPILSTLEAALTRLEQGPSPNEERPPLGAAQGARALLNHCQKPTPPPKVAPTNRPTPPSPHLKGILGPDVPIERWYPTLQATPLPPRREGALEPERLIVLLEAEPFFEGKLPQSPKGPNLLLCPGGRPVEGATPIDLEDEPQAMALLSGLNLEAYDGVVALLSPKPEAPWESLGDAAQGGILDLLYLVMKHEAKRLEIGAFAVGSVAPLPEHHGPLHPVTGLFSGMLKGVARELPKAAIIAYHTDVPDAVTALKGLKDEWMRQPQGGSVEVICRGGHRLEVRLALADNTPEARAGAGVPWLTSRSVILATGGARGVTAELLEGVLRRFACTVILTGRTDPSTLPQSWTALSLADAEAGRTAFYREALAKKEPGVTIAKLKRRFDAYIRTLEVRETIEHLSALPGRVAYISADVTDPDSLNALLDQSLGDFGGIDCVIHGAGIQRSRGIAKKPLSELRQVIATKIAGLLAIRHGLKDRDAEGKTRYHLLTSAFSHLGNDGQPDYGAANEAMGRLATYLDGGGQVTAMGWLGWASVGMTKGSEYAALAANRGLKAITPDEGRAVFLPVLEGTPATPETILLTRGERRFYGVPEGHLHCPQGAWSGSIGLEREAALMVGDHRVRGQATLPGTFEAELASRAARTLWPEAKVVAMEGIKLLKFVRWPRGKAPSLIARARVEEMAGGVLWVRVQLLSDLVHPKGFVLAPGRLHFEACVGLSTGVDLLDNHIVAPDPKRGQLTQDPYLIEGSPIHLKGAFNVLDRVQVGPLGITGRFRCQGMEALPGLQAFQTPALLLDALFRLSMIQIHPDGRLPINVPLACGQTRLRPGLRDVDLQSKGAYLLLEAAPPEGDGKHMYSPWARALSPQGQVLLDVRDLRAQGVGTVSPPDISSHTYDIDLGPRRGSTTEA